MGSYQYELAAPPDLPRHRELWLQHATGFILFEDVREYAIERLDPDLSVEARAAAVKAIDDAVYGLMMVIDGVSGCLFGPTQKVQMRFVTQLLNYEDEVEFELDLARGDGSCMGFHGWIVGDFGEDPIANRRHPEGK